MSGLLGALQLGQIRNPQILIALLLVNQVQGDLQALLPQASATGTANVGETQIQRWQGALQTAARLLQQIPTPLIYPPPAFALFANAAQVQISQALATIQSIPIAQLRIVNPPPGRANIPLETLQSLLVDLRQAAGLLQRALWAA